MIIVPGPRATDSADLQAHAHAHLGGRSRQLEQTRCKTPHPSCGGGRGYVTWFRWDQLETAVIREDVDVSLSSIRQWRERLEPYRATGNKAREQILGVDLINLMIFLRAWPESQLEEMAVFLYNDGGPLYSIDVISKRLAELKITKKRASTEASQAQREDVQFRIWSFWNCSSPLVIFEVPSRKLIDVDEFGITLEKCNRTGGWALKVFCVRKDGHYHHGAKVTVLFAIKPGDPRLPPHVRGSVQHPRHWIRCIQGVGTTTNIVRDFCDYICTEIEQFSVEGTDDHRIYIWDNLA